jgi:hypothetical protein
VYLNFSDSEILYLGSEHDEKNKTFLKMKSLHGEKIKEKKSKNQVLGLQTSVHLDFNFLDFDEKQAWQFFTLRISI